MICEACSARVALPCPDSSSVVPFEQNDKLFGEVIRVRCERKVSSKGKQVRVPPQCSNFILITSPNSVLPICDRSPKTRKEFGWLHSVSNETSVSRLELQGTSGRGHIDDRVVDPLVEDGKLPFIGDDVGDGNF